jgi:hypothetical protein
MLGLDPSIEKLADFSVLGAHQDYRVEPDNDTWGKEADRHDHLRRA